MKGIIFTEFMEMVEDRFSEDVAEEIIELADLPSGGSYTSLGTYSHAEVLNLVTCLSQVSGAKIEDLVQAFGEYLFGRFADVHADFFENVSGSLDFMMKVEDYIHIEVQKLYPEANPPKLSCDRIADNEMTLHYASHRPFAPLAKGLIQGCAAWFKETIEVSQEDLPGSGPGTEARFHLVKVA
ncbi:MAG: heme NO-binding domain-containing protein [Endozoicomonas sp.]